MPDFEIGDRVICTIPQGFESWELEDPEIFNAGWDADEMPDYVGQEGVIIKGPQPAGSGFGYDYQIEFNDGNRWWWDERFVQRPADANAKPTIEIDEETFAGIFVR